jgi:predicted Zn-dependent protease
MRRLLALLYALLLAGCQSVPLTGRSQLQMISEGAEMSLGLSAYQDVLRKEKVSHDPALNELVTRVGSRIAEATGKTGYKWEFRVIDNDKLANAFCLPGGKVAVYTGILPVTRDEAGLAAVIGHEVAHAVARHGGERMSQQLLLEGGITLATAVSVKDERKADLYATLLGVGATFGILLPYSRLHESEADRLGLIYMAKAGYDPRAARDFWARMAAHDSKKGKPPEWLSSHPADDKRIRQIEQWLPEALSYYRPK